jgi:hypothetical protein
MSGGTRICRISRYGGDFIILRRFFEGYSRMILSWGLFLSMESWTVQAVVQEATERYHEAYPRLITDIQRGTAAQCTVLFNTEGGM